MKKIINMSLDERKAYIRNRATERVMKKIGKGIIRNEKNYNFNRMYGFR